MPRVLLVAWSVSRSPLLILLAFALCLCGCDAGGSSSLSESADIGPAGGALALTAADGTELRLTFPVGALTQTTRVKITALSSSSGGVLGPLSTDFLLEPEGLAFDPPVSIDVALADTWAADRAPAILHTGLGGAALLLETQVNGEVLSALLGHFSRATPVAPTGADLEVYWDSILLAIDTYGVSVDLVWALVGGYLHGLANAELYAGIDLAAWRIELWAQTNDLIVKGSLACSGGAVSDGESILKAAVNVASIMLFTDLEAEAQEALENCEAGEGTIVIDQTPDALVGAGWSLSGPRSEAGSGDVTLRDMPTGEYTLAWDAVSGYLTPVSSSKTLHEDETIAFSGAYLHEAGDLPAVQVRLSNVCCERQIDACLIVNDVLVLRSVGWVEDNYEGWFDVSHLITEGSNAFRFVIYLEGWWDELASATFQVRVDDAIEITREFAEYNPNPGEALERGTVIYEETVLRTF